MEKTEKSLIIKRLMREQGISQREMSKKIGESPQQISNRLNGPSPISTEFLLKLRTVLGDEILPLIEDERIAKILVPSVPAVESGLPVYEDAYFGCSPGGFMGALKDADARMAVPGIADDGRTFVVRARGESMVNRDNPSRSIPDGAYVAIQKTALSTPLWGEAYALATDDGCIIKRLYPSEREGCVRCVSINADEFPAFELRTEEIHDFGLVKAVITVAIWR